MLSVGDQILIAHTLHHGLSQKPASQAAAPSSSHTSSLENLRTLQAAEEEQEAAAAARSKASAKRARKKAAARAAAAADAAEPLPAAAAPPQRGQSSSVSMAADVAAGLQSLSLADGVAAQADSAAGNRGGRPSTPATVQAADGGQQQLQQPPEWMLCPITKVRSVQALATLWFV
jgi:hypothetical protein